jgi:Raf kinase inhibitor-like YbhB/YbcL family protein
MPNTAPAATAAPDVPFALTSSAFAEGETIPNQYTYRLTGQCDGANLSPELKWSGSPAETQSFVIIVIDPDGGDWVHWVQFNIPGDVTSLPEAAGGPDIGVKGKNDFGELGYGGPCPPDGEHRYVFTLYALDTTLSQVEGAPRVSMEAAMADHVLGTAQLTGLRSP